MLHVSSGFILHQPGQLPARRSNVTAARFARGGHDIRFHQHITEAANRVLLGALILRLRERVERDQIEFARHLSHQLHQFRPRCQCMLLFVQYCQGK